MEKLTLGIIVAALLVVSAIGLVAISYNDDNNGKKISAADLMPDIDVFPDGWEKGTIFIGPHALPEGFEGELFLQLNYWLGDTGTALTVSIAVCDTVEDAEKAFAFGKAYNAPVTDYPNEFDQCYTYGGGTDKFFVFQHGNIYGVLQSKEYTDPLNEEDLDNIMGNIKIRILSASA